MADSEIDIGIDIESRLASKLDSIRATLARRSVETDCGCLEWTGAKCVNGYGRVKVCGKLHGAHRLAVLVRDGSLPPSGLFVCHSCDNPSCINPDHLFVGTNSDNMRDAFAKGRVRPDLICEPIIDSSRSPIVKHAIQRRSKRRVAKAIGVSPKTLELFCERNGIEHRNLGGRSMDPKAKLTVSEWALMALGESDKKRMSNQVTKRAPSGVS